MYRMILNKNENSIVIFDMDGVLCEYRYYEGDRILNGDVNIYLNKRPIKESIKFLKKCIKGGKECYIVTSCVNEAQYEAKKTWIKQYIPFFPLNRIICIFHNDFKERIDAKVNKIIEIFSNANHRKCYVIEDTHDILRKIHLIGNADIIPVHVINIFK